MYKGLDILKYICALLVVYIHTYCYETGWGWVKDIICPVAVPFFFIASGFFFSKGLAKNKENSWVYCKKYIKRVSEMYLLWTLLSLPVAWMNISIAHAEYAWWLKCIYIIRCLFLTGSIGIYWYVLSLIYNSAIIYFFEKKKHIYWLYILSIVSFGIGVLYSIGTIGGTPLYHAIHIIWGSERNFLFVGLLYMCIGHFIATRKKQIFSSRKFLWLLFLFFIISVRFISKNALVSSAFQLPAAVFLFLFGLNWNPKISDSKSLLLRRWSTIIYLSHFPFILAFDYYLKRGTLVDYFCTLFFCVVFYFSLKAILPDLYLKKLYGS